jgi:hypothetical protein
VTYNSNDMMFVVHREPENSNMEFRMHASGLHCYDPLQENAKQMAFVNTVAENMSNFSKREVKGAEAAKALHIALERLSMNDFNWIFRSNQIKDSPVALLNVQAATSIWGKSFSKLKGSATRIKLIPVSRDYIKIPKELLNLHREVFLTADMFFVNKIPFFLTLSRKTCFTAVNHLANRTVLQMFQAFKEACQCYLQRGFRITVVYADGEFAPLKILIECMPGGPMVNLASANEHVPEIERRIRTVKERCQSCRHGLPYEQIPKLMTIYIVLQNVKMLNFFPLKGGTSEHLSPRTMSGEALDHKKHLRLPLRQCCQVQEEETPCNSMKARTKGAISLGPNGNLQGGYRFMALDTGKKITRRNWDVIPTPGLVIARMNMFGKDQPKLLAFADQHGRLIGDAEVQDTANNIDNSIDNNDDVDFAGVYPAISDHIEIPGVDDEEGPEHPTPQEIEVIDDLDAPSDPLLLKRRPFYKTRLLSQCHNRSPDDLVAPRCRLNRDAF